MTPKDPVEMPTALAGGSRHMKISGSGLSDLAQRYAFSITVFLK